MRAVSERIWELCLCRVLARISRLPSPWYVGGWLGRPRPSVIARRLLAIILNSSIVGEHRWEEHMSPTRVFWGYGWDGSTWCFNSPINGSLLGLGKFHPSKRGLYARLVPAQRPDRIRPFDRMQGPKLSIQVVIPQFTARNPLADMAGPSTNRP